MFWRNPWLYLAMVLGGLLWLCIGLVVGAALGVSAQTDEVASVAHEAGVDPIALQGAVSATQLEPRTYLVMTGELSQPRAMAPSIPSVWSRLAACESTGRWHANTGNGYYGGLQADMTFWRRHGGLAFAARPDLATPDQQILVAQRGQAVQGWGAWPVCSRRLGLR